MSGNQASLRPRDATDLAELVATHAGALEPVGGGSKRSVGRPVTATALELDALSGIVDYSSAELVLTAAAATPLDQIQGMLNGEGQRLAFEPPDLGPLLGVDARQTLGGVLAANLSGSRRVAAGAARDHFLGFEAVSGKGERFRAGGKVVKNVTGYDLPKLLAGSWGQLAVMSEVTVRVAPRPEREVTLIVDDRSPETALGTMTAALGSALEVSAAAFDPWRGTALRLEGFPGSVAAREQALAALLDTDVIDRLSDHDSRSFWQATGGGAIFAEWPVVWRISVPPSHAPRVVAGLAPERYTLDWGGGLIWAAYAAVEAARVRGAIREGHATLLKAPAAARSRTCIQQAPSAAVGALGERVKAAFDPDNKLNPGRMD